MNQPPNRSYPNSFQQQKQAQGFPQPKVYNSSQRPARNYPQSVGPKTQGNASGQAPHVSFPAGRVPSSQRKNSEPDWSKLTELPVKPKTLHRRLVDLITVTVILALIAGGTITYFNLSNGQGSGQPVVINVVVPTEIPETPGIGALGKPTQAGVWLATITHTKAVANQALSSQKQVYLEINLALKNTSATPQILAGFLEFLLADSNGRQIHEALTDPNIHQSVTGYVATAQTLQAQLAFEVPKSTHSYILTFRYGLVENSTASVNWTLTV